MAGSLVLMDITKGFSGGLQVLNGLEAEIPAGRVFAILGHSGCGKTTLLRIIAGFERPERGCVLLDDRERTAPDNDILMMFQSYDQLFPWLTLKDNLRMALKWSGKETNRKKAEQLSMEYLEKTGLTGFEDTYPYKLSGGMKQRGALARALCLQPRVLLMDEPFSSLDYSTRSQMQSLLMRLQKELGTTVVFVTHDIDEAVSVGESVAVMRSGALTLCQRDTQQLKKLITGE